MSFALELLTFHKTGEGQSEQMTNIDSLRFVTQEAEIGRLQRKITVWQTCRLKFNNILLRIFKKRQLTKIQ